MKAMVFSQYGSPEELRYQDVPMPVASANEVRIKIHAASINDWDWGLLQGQPFINRLLFGLFKPGKPILGCDLAGTVDAVGAAVTGLKPGDRVFGDLSDCGFGAFAEFVCAPEEALVKMPPPMSFEDAAAIPQAGALALQGLKDKHHLASGQRLLINGAGGGVGTLAVQIARQYDLHVTGVDSADKLPLLRQLGFDAVLDYRQTDFTQTGDKYDLILDVKTNRSPMDYVRALAPEGSYVTVGGEIPKLLQTLLWARWVRHRHNKNLCILALQQNQGLEQLNTLYTKGKLKPVIDSHYSLQELPEAMKRFGAAKHQGKIIITMV